MKRQIMRTPVASCCTPIFCFFFVYAVVAVTGPSIFIGEFMIEGNSTLTVNPGKLVNLELQSGTIEEAVTVAECRIIGDETTCWCRSEHIWSDTVVEEYSKCLNKPECVANISYYTPLCIPKVSVKLMGQITIKSGVPNTINTTLATQFKTMNGFEWVLTTISRYTADFEVKLSAVFKTTKLDGIIKNLKASLGAYTTVESTGLVEMFIPQMEVPYKEPQNLSCTIDDTLSSCTWSIARNKTESPATIGNGTQVKVGSWCSNSTTLQLLMPVEIWDGLYTCTFTSGSISHKASGDLNVALLPDKITITSLPQTADCTDSSKPIVVVKCGILPPSRPMNYIVTLFVTDKVFPMVKNNTNSEEAEEKIWYTKTIDIYCHKTKKLQSLNATCEFKNSINQTQTQNLIIPILRASDRSCAAEGPWPKTKADANATSNCPAERVGHKIRYCNANGDWQPELDFCVNEAINKLSSSVEKFQYGFNATTDVAKGIFSGLKNNSDTNMTLGDVDAVIGIMDVMAEASSVNEFEDDSMMNDFIDSASNIVSINWTPNPTITKQLSTNYLKAVEGLVTNIKVNTSEGHNASHIQFQVCRSDNCNRTVFGVEMALSTTAHMSKVVVLKDLANRLPNKIRIENSTISTEKGGTANIVVSATLENPISHTANITLIFPFNKATAPSDYTIYCVYWHTNKSQWSTEGCEMREEGDNIICTCNHLTSFSSLMSKEPDVNLPFLEQITYIGLGISICSLLVFLFIEWLVWSTIVKSNLSHFRHTSLVNIALCLLLADCSFLAAPFLKKFGKFICLVLVLAQHFFFTAMFFWMLCLSLMLLHQLIFVFSPLRKRVFMMLSFTIGYASPTVTVAVSYVYYEEVSNTSYHDPSRCWLTYIGPMKGSLHAFLFPVGVITLMNLFSMVVVIMTLLRPKVSEGKADDKETVKSILKAVVFLTPVFGVTWLLGFFVFSLGTKTAIGILLHYAFTIVNSLQGFLILVTGVLGEKKVRDEVLKYIVSSKSTKSESKQNLTSSIKK